MCNAFKIGSARSFRVVTFVYSIGFKFMTMPIKKHEREREKKCIHVRIANNADMANEYIFYVNSFPVITF